MGQGTDRGGLPPTVVLADSDAVADEAVVRILAAAQQAIAARGRFDLVLAGGSTPKAAYALLAKAGEVSEHSSAANTDIDWPRWYIWFGDERCLPADDPDRNSVMADRAWLHAGAIPRPNIHPIPAELGAEAAAESYARMIASVRRFDLVLLGMGEDGHTASLFPGHRHDPLQTVHPVHHAPKPPPDRVSLSAAVINQARAVLMLVTGAGKQDAVVRWRAGAALPIASIHGDCVTLLMDAVAAGGSPSPGQQLRT